MKFPLLDLIILSCYFASRKFSNVGNLMYNPKHTPLYTSSPECSRFMPRYAEGGQGLGLGLLRAHLDRGIWTTFPFPGQAPRENMSAGRKGGDTAIARHHLFLAGVSQPVSFLPQAGAGRWGAAWPVPEKGCLWWRAVVRDAGGVS